MLHAIFKNTTMKKTKNCKVDTVHVSLQLSKDSKVKYTFEDILNHNEINGKELRIRGKSVQFEVIENNNDILIGFVRSIMDKDLPAKINKKSKEISALDVSNEEGIAYGNIILYSKVLNTLFYEVNKNSIYLDVFKELIYDLYLKSTKLKEECSFNLEFSTIFRKNEYERALKMQQYKSFKLKVYQPKELLNEYLELNSSTQDLVDLDFMPELEKAAKLNSDFAEVEFKVENIKGGGLYKNKIEPMIRNLGKLLKLGQFRSKIDTIEVCGYDAEYSNKKIPIDLIGDVYFCNFKLDVPRLDSNLQKEERKNAITEVYNKEFPILVEYL